MSNLENMYRAVLFIDRHLKEPISVKDVADAADYSLYHFSRTFNSLIGHSPYDYIIRRRLSESARQLMETDARIVDVAAEYQFNNPETFSRAFRRMFGVLPNQVKRNKSLTRLIFKSETTLEYLQHINQGRYLKPSYLELDAFHVAGMICLVDEDTNVITRLWEVFFPQVQNIPDRLLPERYYGMSFYLPSTDTLDFFHMACVEVNSLDNLPLSLVGKTIPAFKYARFVHKGLSRNVGLTFDYIYQTWLPKSGNSISALLELEYFGGRYLGPDDPSSESEILIPID